MPTNAESTDWTEYANNPVFDPDAKVYYPSVIYDAIQFSGHGDVAYYKMWFGSKQGTGGVYSIGYAYSNDGVDWTEGLNPVSGLSSKPNHPLVEYDPDGFGTGVYYKIWYWDNNVSIYSINAIRYAESSNGINWINDQALTQDDTYKLVTGTWPDWNYGSYGPGDVIYNPSGSDTLDDTDIWNNKYVMYYMGTNGNNEFIGLAYSTNGTHWKRYGDNPVLSPCTLEDDPTVGWDYRSVGYPTVIKGDDGTWRMWFCGGPGTNHGIGYATSLDGINWTKDQNNPIFHKDDEVAWRSKRTYTPMVIYDADHFSGHGPCCYWKMWYSGKEGSNYAAGYAGAGPCVMPKPVPEYNFFGLLALVGILSIVLAVETSKRRR